MLPQTAIYALRAMGYLAKHGQDGPVLARTISGEMEIPRNFLSKIMNRLVSEGLVLSARGSGGGFRVARPAAEVPPRNVISPFVNLGRYKRCFLGLKECDGSCRVHGRWLGISEQLEQLLADVTIDRLL
jgi:Rrf2 family transcriptional regulator, iron-sulfur cluster assembly transcription factor